MNPKTVLLTLLTFLLSACGTLTGIPSHGGGKRFAVEQELVAASARAAVKEMDLRPLQGRRTAVFVSVMGDQGSGTISGGRYSVDALIRGEYLNTPATRTDYTYPRYETTAQSDSGGLSGLTTSLSTLNAPASSRSRNDGPGSRSSIGLNLGGMGDYRNETLTANPQDSAFLGNLIRTVLYLRGIQTAPAEQADAVLFVNADVFGTIRSRTELHLYNAETLKAQTKLEYFAIDSGSGQLLIPPKNHAYEAAYREQYALWTGPYKVSKTLKTADPLMVGFDDIRPYGSPAAAASATAGTTEETEAAAAQEPAAQTRPADEILRKRREEGSK